MNTETESETPLTDRVHEEHEGNPSARSCRDLAADFEIALWRIANFDRDVTGGPEMVDIAEKALGLPSRFAKKS